MKSLPQLPHKTSKHKITTSLSDRLTDVSSKCKLTNLHDPSKHRRVVHSAAVPSPLPKLVLALLDARLGSISNVDHVVLVQLAQLPLALQTAQQHRRD